MLQGRHVAWILLQLKLLFGYVEESCHFLLFIAIWLSLSVLLTLCWSRLCSCCCFHYCCCYCWCNSWLCRSCLVCGCKNYISIVLSRVIMKFISNFNLLQYYLAVLSSPYVYDFDVNAWFSNCSSFVSSFSQVFAFSLHFLHFFKYY